MTFKSTYLLIIFATCVLATIPANAYDFTLNVYGNANMDDVIDENDIEYVQGIIEGTNEETELADANYDGLIDESDISQVESLLSGDETDVTIVDVTGRTITLKMPIERAIVAFPGASTLAADLGFADKIVGADGSSINNAEGLLLSHVNPEIEDMPNVGMSSDFNQEVIVSLEPDVIFAVDWSLSPDIADTILKNTGIPVVYPGYFNKAIRFDAQGGSFDTWRQIGLLFGKRERAEELISYWEEETDKVVDITSEIPNENRPKVYLAGFASFEDTLGKYDPIELAGGINLADGLLPNNLGVVTLSKEQIIDWNPDIILIHRATKSWVQIEDVLSDPTLQTVNAIKNNRVYYLRVAWGGRIPAGELTECFYLAKLFYPEKFSELDVESEGNNIFEEFYGVEGLYSWVQDYCELHTWEN